MIMSTVLSFKSLIEISLIFSVYSIMLSHLRHALYKILIWAKPPDDIGDPFDDINKLGRFC